MKLKSGAIIGDGVCGVFTAIALARRGWNVTLFRPPPAARAPRPFICPEVVAEILQSEIPELPSLLASRQVRRISVEELIASQFGDQNTNPDNRVGFFCCRSTLLQALLEELAAQEPLMQFQEAPVTGLLTSGSRIVGVKLRAEEKIFDVVIDASGVQSRRQEWLKQCRLPADTIHAFGPEYSVHTKYYQYLGQDPLYFKLIAHRTARGGLYPLEHGQFAVTFFTARSRVSHESLLAQAPELTAILNQSRETGEAFTFRGLRSYRSNFYERNCPTRVLRGFFPLGETIYASNPLYGRGVALALMQARTMVKLLEKHIEAGAEMHEQFAAFQRSLKKVWRFGLFPDAADEAGMSPRTVLARCARAYYDRILAPLLHQDASYLRNFLDIYQMRSSPRSLWSPRFHLLGMKHYVGSLLNA